VTFRPRLRTRVAFAVAVVLVFLAMLGVVDLVRPVPGPIVLSCMVLVMYVAVRGSRMGVRVRPDLIVVRGCLWTRTVGRGDTRGISRGFAPMLRWIDRFGRVRRSPLVMFMILPSYVPFDEDLAERLAALTLALDN